MTTWNELDPLFERIGHDLRGELSTMLAGVRFVLRYESGLSERAKDLLGRVDGAGERLGRMLEELGQAAWIIAPPMRASLHGDVDVRALVDDVVARLEPLAKERGVAFAVRLSGARPRSAGDADALRLALGHVLEFALLRSTEGVLAIDVAAHGSTARVVVRDRGPTVDGARLADLAAPFVEKEFLVPSSDGAVRRRLGLGLAISRGIFRAHGGDLRAESSPAQGAIDLVCDLGSVATMR